MKYTGSLKHNRDFRRLYAKGKSAVSPYFAVYYRKNRLTFNRLGITVGGKLGNAVTRNRLRRRIKEIYRTNETRFLTGYDIVVVGRTRAVSARYAALEESMIRLAAGLSLLSETLK
ncbi:Ribonuclease P protein component [bioreactor metagenome]|uniref:Ribonuclease P protein component n=1 Tax=bioreactor metagenome TaxID=1076179 RepID=A0A644WD65_9ZZZZ